MKKYLLIALIFSTSVVFPQTGVTYSKTFTSGGVARTYTMYVPNIYTGSTPVPLIFNIHGWTGSSAKQESYADFRKIADTANFIIIHPMALGAPPSWATSETVGPSATDKAYLMNILDTMIANYNINTDRVYSTGFSQGGSMSYDFACFYSTRFAAIASVGAGMSTAHASACTPQHPIPVMEIHGTEDRLATYTGGTGRLSVDSVIKFWVNFNGCNPVPAYDSIPNLNTTDSCHVEHYVYTGGDQGSTVELYKVINGDHQWPSDVTTTNVYGLGFRNADFSASKEIWRFFSQYTKMVDIDEQVANSAGVLIYPNPSTGIFRVEVKNSQNATITIVNVLGETISEKKISGSTETIDLSAAPAGIYFYQVANQTGIISSGKLIVE